MATHIFEGLAQEVLRGFPKGTVDLVVTSPPYDDMRSYETDSKGEGWGFEVFELVAEQLTRVVKRGGVVVWNVGDKTSEGSESGSSFRQVLKFMSLGWRLVDTMIWEKTCSGALGSNRAYLQNFEYMFVLANGAPHVTFNPIKDRPNSGPAGKTIRVNQSLVEGKATSHRVITSKEYGRRTNIWRMAPRQGSWHPAPFPSDLAEGHIRSWSNPGEVVLDPFAGSGTTLEAARTLGRHAVGIEASPTYATKLREMFTA